MEDKLVIISTHGPENSEKATLPFVLATAAQTVDVKVVVILQANAVMVAKKGEAEAICAPGFLPLKGLVDTFLELGGELLLCTPCVRERGIGTQELVEGAVSIAAGTVVTEVLSAKSVVTY
jgi:uncharacterized protein involved in oxidation of intracellular sulfur